MKDKDKQEPVSRRAFLKRAGTTAFSTGASLLPGAAIARAALSAKDALTQRLSGKALAEENVAREDITYPSGSDRINATILRPKNLKGTAPAVIVVHDIFGLTDHIRDVAARLAKTGYVALAPDLYTREGSAPEGADIAALRAFTAKITDERVVADLQAGAKYLAGRSEVKGRKIGTVGFCMGGTYALLFAAQTPSLGAGVVFYGRPLYKETTPEKPVSPLALVPRLKVPLQAHYGEADAGIPLADVDALRRALKEAGVPHEVFTYKDAPHAFHNDTRESYREAAAKEAWQRTLAFFDGHLKGA